MPNPWDNLDHLKYQPEAEAVRALLAAQPLDASGREGVGAEAVELVRAARRASKRSGIVEAFLQRYSLSSQEGMALLGLAEALLRTPDAATRDRLIAEKIGAADWASHAGLSASTLVNASTRGLMLAGKLVGSDGNSDEGWLTRLVARLGEPLIRQAIGAAVRIMGDEFVLGRSIGEAIERARREKTLCSFDMLGEGARTEADAARYERLYTEAIEAVGRANEGAGPELGHGISVKLSALSPRYEAVYEARVLNTLYPRLLRLALMAAHHDLNFAIDAEEADRLVISLKLFERLAREPALAGWNGLGIVVQAYQKRALETIEGLADLARSSGRRIMVRLVKGAYWDSEIKRAQVSGHADYPVFTTKPATDLSYLVCAARLIEAAPHLYPQFATHNAHTLAAVRRMAAQAGIAIEHQRLHGMGEALYAAAAKRWGPLLLRTYAPVGGHEELLPYLVRRLLENGANSSFVHTLLDEQVPAEEVVSDPIALVEAAPGPHPRIVLPGHLYGPERANPLGRDYSIAVVRAAAEEARSAVASGWIVAGPLVGGMLLPGDGGARPVKSPADRSLTLGETFETAPDEVDRAVTVAKAAQPAWDALGGAGRAVVLRRMGDALEREFEMLVALLSLEAGKTLNDGVAEVREAVDFCRYYAHLAERQFAGPVPLAGPVGETNCLELRARGVFACISPWNFPLAIFAGQVVAALAAGNAVLAKPAEQTVLVAAEAVRLFFEAGLDPDLLALLPGDGAKIGPIITAHPGVDGIAFTGGTATAWAINRALAARDGPIVPLIAETGGLNGMFVDSTALKEQVVDDVMASAFGSAGQRCSALRLLYLPEATADGISEALGGALDALVIGDPADPATDLGPVIDEAARDSLMDHVARLDREARILHRRDLGSASGHGCYFAPVIAEVPRPDFLEREVFGPILHIYRYKPGELDQVAAALAARRYGLTLGVHSRVGRFADEVRRLVPAGNVYVNRSITGAVVGVQPFGGEGLSGTGPKAGGPHALLRYSVERTVSVNITAQGGDPALLNL
jgi:RHH-type proline utilization regulon transcriptional repressor/proline dehydrogenase/delta 1-pyrroline-5-carboxylate dehydrogenase